MSRLFRGRRLLQRALWEQAQQAGFTSGSKVQADAKDGKGSQDGGEHTQMATAGSRRR